jgi:hypothetical protein
MGRKNKIEELTEFVKELSAFTYSVRFPNTIPFNHTVLAQTEKQAGIAINKEYPGAVHVLSSGSKRVSI